MARRFLPFACTPLFRFLWKIDRFFRHLVHPISLFFFPNCYYLATISNYPYEKRCRSRTNESIIMIIRIKENGSKDTAFERRWRTAESKEARRKKDRSGGKNMGIGGQDISEGPVPRTWWSSSPPPPPRRRLQNGKKRGRTKTVARRNDAAAGIPRNDICSPLFRVLCHEGTTAPPFARGSPLLSSSRSRNCDRYRVLLPSKLNDDEGQLLLLLLLSTRTSLWTFLVVVVAVVVVVVIRRKTRWRYAWHAER